jgi:hypothetical protein
MVPPAGKAKKFLVCHEDRNRDYLEASEISCSFPNAVAVLRSWETYDLILIGFDLVCPQKAQSPKISRTTSMMQFSGFFFFCSYCPAGRLDASEEPTYIFYHFSLHQKRNIYI